MDGKPIGRISNPAMRSPRRVPLQAMLAGLSLQCNETNFESSISVPTELIEWTGSNNLLIHTVDQSAQGSIENSIFIAPEAWQSLLSYLITTCHYTPARNLGELHRELINWGKDPSSEFHWVADISSNRNVVPVNTSRISLRSTQQVIADQVFESIVTNIWNGKLTAGDRITESSLAKDLRTTRNQTRDALRSLASSGLVDHHPVRGVLVPTPKKSDIADIYAARRALGTEILRRVAEKPDFALEAVATALAQVIAVAKTGNSYETGNADLYFQDVIAENSGMRNIPQLFSTLAKQLRIYISVMGMGYIYSIDAMVTDDTELFNHLAARNFTAARDTWNRKINDSLEFMTGHISARK